MEEEKDSNEGKSTNDPNDVIMQDTNNTYELNVGNLSNSQEISAMSIPKDKVSSLLNEGEKYKIKINKIKNKLRNSFLEQITIKNVTKDEINFKSLESLLKYFKIYNENIKASHKKQILYYTKLGNIIKHIKIIHPLNWQDILKKNQIKHSTQYLNFLIQLYELFEKNKILYKSSLNLSFFKRNFYIIKQIANRNELK